MKRKEIKPTTRATARPEACSLSAEHRKMAKELSVAEEHVALAALDALSAQIAMLDGNGNVLAINKAWRDFAKSSERTDRALPGTNYFVHCGELDSESAHFAELSENVQMVLDGERDDFVLEYPCITGEGEKWFHVRVMPCNAVGPVRVVIAHEDISERVELERDIVGVREREQQRFRQELHDGLSQQLTGLKFKASLLEYHLQSKQLSEANDAKALSQLLNEATEEASQLARRMRPVEVEARGFMMALRELAANAEQQHDLTCAVTISRPVFIHDNNVAMNLFHIADEAVNSAATQGEATKIQITLSETGKAVTLTIRDNGKPLKERQRESLGAHLMRYHARIIGGLLEWRRESPRGVTLFCRFQKRIATAR